MKSTGDSSVEPGISKKSGTPEILERLLVLLGLMMSTGVTLGTTADSNVDPISATIWVIVYGFSAIFLLSRLNTYGRVIVANPYIPALVGLALLSCLWADQPVVSLQRSLGLVGTTVFGFYLGVRWRPEEVFRMLLKVFAVIAVASTVVALTHPERGVHMGDSWRGIFPHKNGLGRLMAFATASFMMELLEERKLRFFKLCATAVGLTLVFFSNSSTALITLLIVSLASLAIRVVKFPKRAFLPTVFLGLTALMGISIYAISRFDAVLMSLGRDASLTGRTVLWELVWRAITHRPWLGYGYGSFWTEGGPADRVLTFLLWEAAHAHNGFLETLLQLGGVGLVLFAASYMQNLLSAVLSYQRSGGKVSLFFVVFLLFLLISNITESNLIGHNTLFWVLYVALPISLAREFALRPK